MIGYLDTSAFVPLLIHEPSSTEAAVALAPVHRMGRLIQNQHRQSLRRLDQTWHQMDVVIEVDERNVIRCALRISRTTRRWMLWPHRETSNY